MTSAASTSGAVEPSGEPPASRKRRLRPSRIALHAFLILTVLRLAVADPVGDLHRAAAVLGHVRARLRLVAEARSTSQLHERLDAVATCRTTSGTR